ncbi:MAG: hypothetical protein KC469_11800 [Flavobacteriaceae bacterium]|nr:hypothetical protein [Flavobacteriaceae bacterium]
MNIRSSTKLLLIIILTHFSTESQATKCSSVKFETELNSNKIVELLYVGTKKLNKNNKSNNDAKEIFYGEKTHLFKPGNYSLLVRVWDKLFYESVFQKYIHNSFNMPFEHDLKYRKAKIAFLENTNLAVSKKISYREFRKKEKFYVDYTQSIPLNVEIDNNSSYSFKLNENTKTFTTVIKAKTSSNCSSQNKVFDNSQVFKKMTDDLPPTLEFRLKEIMDALDDFRNKHAISQHNLTYAKTYPYFGAILSNKNSQLKGYSVISVQPYSLAYKMGLLSGDTIISMGNNAINDLLNGNEALAKYLATIELNHKIEIDVQRSDKRITLSQKYVTTTVPLSIYSTDVKGEGKINTLTQKYEIPDLLEFEYEQILLALKNHYKRQLKKSNIEISREASLSKKYGIKGKVVELAGINTFRVTDVSSKSTAGNMGIKVNDMILSIAGSDINNKRLPFGKAINDLVEGQEHQVKLIRNNINIVLNGSFISHLRPAFSLKIVSPNKYINSRLNKYNSKTYQRDYRDMNFGGQNKSIQRSTPRYSGSSKESGDQ